MKQILKYLMLAVASITTFNVKTTTLGYFCLYNDTNDSFEIKAHMPDNDFEISELHSSKPERNKKVSEFSGHTALYFSSRFPKEQRPGEEDAFYLSFEREGCEFQALFFNAPRYRYPFIKLVSNMATELHNNIEADSYDYEFFDERWGQYLGRIINWIIVDKYRVVYFYEKHGRGRGIVIEYVTDDATWMEEVREDDMMRRLGLEGSRYYGRRPALRPQPKSWFAEHFCCCCGD